MMVLGYRDVDAPCPGMGLPFLNAAKLGAGRGMGGDEGASMSEVPQNPCSQ